LLAASRKRETLLLHNSQCPGDKNKLIAQKGNCFQYKIRQEFLLGSSERTLWVTVNDILDNILTIAGANFKGPFFPRSTACIPLRQAVRG
jgi:hypothetical protein